MWFGIRIVLLGLWVGAMVAFAFVFAPIAFAHIGPTPAFAATIAACVRALVRIGDAVALLCAVLTLVAPGQSRRRAAFIVALLALTMLAGFYETGIIVPRMETTPLQTPAYDALHRQSSTVYGIALLAAFAALIASLRRPYST
jgi:hypothetical protein